MPLFAGFSTKNKKAINHQLIDKDLVIENLSDPPKRKNPAQVLKSLKTKISIIRLLQKQRKQKKSGKKKLKNDLIFRLEVFVSLPDKDYFL